MPAPSTPTSTCFVEGCDREAFRNGLCGSHFKRVQRGQPLGGPFVKLSPLERLIEAASDLAECSTDDDVAFELIRKRVVAASLALARSKGWRPATRRELEVERRSLRA